MLLSSGLCLVADEVFVQLEGNTHVLSVGYVPCLGVTSLKIVELLTEYSESDQIPWLLIRVDLFGLYMSGLIQLRHFCIHLSRLSLSALSCMHAVFFELCACSPQRMEHNGPISAPCCHISLRASLLLIGRLSSEACTETEIAPSCRHSRRPFSPYVAGCNYCLYC